MQKVIVGMADLNFVKYPDILTTIGLGSCVGIALYDPSTKMAGLAHVMLPDSTKIQNNTNEAKFADTAIKKLVSDMLRSGASKSFMRAKIAGGAQMFSFNSTNESMRIGDRNTEAVIKLLAEYRIPIVANDTGNTYGRTIELYSEDGRLVVKTIGHGNKII
ncbi:MAG: chemotaxis protein CheD [Clostridiales bacterium]|jgi:chemotaxis protein CheD|nr:chemotaxis protein CheD [Clostridiales bacterium]